MGRGKEFLLAPKEQEDSSHFKRQLCFRSTVNKQPLLLIHQK